MSDLKPRVNYVQLIRDALLIYRDHYELFVPLGLAFAFVNGAMSTVSIDAQALTIIYMIIRFMISAWIFAVVVLATSDINNRKEIVLKEIIKSPASVYRLLFIAMVSYYVLVAIGVFPLIIPGFYLAVVLFFVDMFVILEKKSVPEAFQASFYLVKGNFLNVFQFLILQSIVYLILMELLLGGNILPMRMSQAIFSCLLVFIGPLFITAKVLLFRCLRRIEENPDYNSFNL